MTPRERRCVRLSIVEGCHAFVGASHFAPSPLRRLRILFALGQSSAAARPGLLRFVDSDALALDMCDRQPLADQANLTDRE